MPNLTRVLLNLSPVEPLTVFRSSHILHGLPGEENPTPFDISVAVYRYYLLKILYSRGKKPNHPTFYCMVGGGLWTASKSPLFFPSLKLSIEITFKVTSSLLVAQPEVKESWSSVFKKNPSCLNMTFRIHETVKCEPRICKLVLGFVFFFPF